MFPPFRSFPVETNWNACCKERLKYVENNGIEPLSLRRSFHDHPMPLPYQANTLDSSVSLRFPFRRHHPRSDPRRERRSVRFRSRRTFPFETGRTKGTTVEIRTPKKKKKERKKKRFPPFPTLCQRRGEARCPTGVASPSSSDFRRRSIASSEARARDLHHAYASLREKRSRFAFYVGRSSSITVERARVRTTSSSFPLVSSQVWCSCFGKEGERTSREKHVRRSTEKKQKKKGKDRSWIEEGRPRRGTTRTSDFFFLYACWKEISRIVWTTSQDPSKDALHASPSRFPCMRFFSMFWMFLGEGRWLDVEVLPTAMKWDRRRVVSSTTVLTGRRSR